MRGVILNADWDPEFLDLKESAIMEVLKKQKLTDLKVNVSKYLKNSWCSKEKSDLLIELMSLTSPNICVEVGAFTGSTALPILAGLKFCGHGKLYAIDAWSCGAAIRGLPSSDVNTTWWGSLDMSAIQTKFNGMLDSWSVREFCHVLHMTSEEAASQIPAIDFLHLDGNFSEAGALLDSKLYVPKVTPGGYILLSNVHVMVAGMPSKMKALTVLLDQCEVVCEIENGQTLLFRKN